MKSVAIGGISETYEAACQRMLHHGLKLLKDNPNERLEFKGRYTLMGANEFTKRFLDEIADKSVESLKKGQKITL